MPRMHSARCRKSAATRAEARRSSSQDAERLARLQFVDHDRGEFPDRAQVVVVGRTRRGVDRAEGADVVPVGGAERNAEVEPDAGPTRDEGIVREPGVPGGVGNDERLALENGVGAERHVPARLPKPGQADAGLQPLPILAHEGDEGDGHAEGSGGEAGDPIEALLGLGSEGRVGAERVKARLLVCRERRDQRRPPPLEKRRFDLKRATLLSRIVRGSGHERFYVLTFNVAL